MSADLQRRFAEEVLGALLLEDAAARAGSSRPTALRDQAVFGGNARWRSRPYSRAARCRSLRSSSGRPPSSAILKAMLMTPSCGVGGVHQAARAAAAPSRQTVVRTGWPCSPNRSQKITGNWPGSRSRSSRSARRASAANPCASPIAADAGKVALHVGAEHRHAGICEKPSARICSVTVLPVPVAPVTRPWRLPNFRSRYSGLLMRVVRLAARADVESCRPQACEPRLRFCR